MRLCLRYGPFMRRAAAVFALRRKRPDLPRAYRTWGYPVTPILFILAVILLVGTRWSRTSLTACVTTSVTTGALFSGSTLPYESSSALLVFAIVLAGIPAYFIWNGDPLEPALEGQRPTAL